MSSNLILENKEIFLSGLRVSRKKDDGPRVLKIKIELQIDEDECKEYFDEDLAAVVFSRLTRNHGSIPTYKTFKPNISYGPHEINLCGNQFTALIDILKIEPISHAVCFTLCLTTIIIDEFDLAATVTQYFGSRGYISTESLQKELFDEKD